MSPFGQPNYREKRMVPHPTVRGMMTLEDVPVTDQLDDVVAALKHEQDVAREIERLNQEIEKLGKLASQRQARIDELTEQLDEMRNYYQVARNECITAEKEVVKLKDALAQARSQIGGQIVPGTLQEDSIRRLRCLVDLGSTFKEMHNETNGMMLSDALEAAIEACYERIVQDCGASLS